MQDNKDKIIEIASGIINAEITNGNRTHYIYEWSPEKQQKIVNAAVSIATKLIETVEQQNTK